MGGVDGVELIEKGVAKLEIRAEHAVIPEKRMLKHHALIKVSAKAPDATTTVSTPPATASPPRRLPITIAAAIDVSGSMGHDGKLEQAKKALKVCVERLTHTEDLVHVVSFHTSAAVEIEAMRPATQRTEIFEAIDKLKPMMATNISDGIEMCAKLIECHERVAGASVRRLKRIFVFSDGDANHGVKTVSGMHELVQRVRTADVAFAAFGIGGDFSQSMMETIAGTDPAAFQFIDSADNMGVYVDGVFGSLLNIVGVKGRVQVLPTATANARGTLRSLRIVNGMAAAKSPDERSIYIGDVWRGGFTNLLVEFEYEAPTSVDSSPLIDLIDVTFTYDSCDASSSTKPVVVTLRGTLKLHTTATDTTDVDADAEVTVAVALESASQISIEVARALERGDVRRAIELNRDATACLVRVAPLDCDDIVEHLIRKSEAYTQKLASEGASALNKRYAYANLRSSKSPSAAAAYDKSVYMT